MSSTSTTFEEAKEAVAQRFNTVWNPTGYQFILGNEKKDNLPAGQPWSRMVTKHVGSTQKTLGQDGCRKFERFAAAFIQVFTPQDIGEQQSAQLVDRILDGFEGHRIPNSTICFTDVIPRETGPTGDEFQVTIEAQFSYVEIK